MSGPSPGARRWRTAVLGTAVLALAAANLTVRIDRQMVEVWDESLYATSALEMTRSGDWLVTTFQGAIDHYNSKPPLNVWLIATAFSTFGVDLVSLRLASMLAAWLTVTLVWACLVPLGPRLAALAAIVLATTYPFLFVHAGRSGNGDALLTLLLTATAVMAWRPGGSWRAFWMGPLTGAAFMLKGPAVMALFAPLLAADLWAARRETVGRWWWQGRVAGYVTGAIVPAWWVIARWQFDGPFFLARMLSYDLAARAAAPIEGHAEPWWFYLATLARYDYEWLVVGACALALAPLPRWTAWRGAFDAATPRARIVGAAWLFATIALPTAIPTKLAWYLNPFYPGLAALVALAVDRVWGAPQPGRWRRAVIAGLVVLAIAAVEIRVWQRIRRLDLDRSAQGLLIAHAPVLEGRRVFARQCPRPEWFLAAAARARCLVAQDLDAFQSRSASGDFWLDRPEPAPPGLVAVGVNTRAALFRRP